MKKFGQFCVLLTVVIALIAPSVRAQDEQEIDATKKLFPEAGGVTALKRGPDGRYYVLTSHAVLIYDANSKLVKRFPEAPAANSKAIPFFGLSMDIAADGRIYVADGAAGAIDVFSPEGVLLRRNPVPSPTSVAALPNGEMAVASSLEKTEISIVDANGKITREFGDPVSVVDDSAANRRLNLGRVVSDPAGNLYFAYMYVPEPTFRKFDRFGYASLDETLNTLEFQGAAQYARKQIARQQQTGAGNIALRKVITAIGVDADSQSVWIAMENLVLVFNRDATEHREYRAYTPENARLPVDAIVVEPDRLILISETLGAYEFARPDKPAPAKADTAH